MLPNRPGSRPLAGALLAALLLGGCGGRDPSAPVPVPIQRATQVIVHDSADVAVSGATVTAIRLDDVASAQLAPTDASGIARFTLAEGRWAVSARVAGGGGPPQVAGSTGRVPGAVPGVPDTVLFRLGLARGAVAAGVVTLAGRVDHSGSLVSLVELPGLATTDASGAFALDGLPPGVWTALAEHAGFKIAVLDVPVPGPAPADTIALPAVQLPPGGAPAPPR